MPITRAKSADRLYEECRGFDLVLVPDPPMAGALNRRLVEPRFGPFATTPRRLAAERQETAEDRRAFLHVVAETGLDWKEAAYAVGNVLQCWEHRGEAGAIREYDAFDTPATGQVLDCLGDLETTASQLAGHRIEADTDVAVVGIEELSPLERSVLPDEYAAIDPFLDEPFDPPPFHVFDSPAAIVDAVLESVTAETAERVAVVLDRASEYAPLVESALEAAGIPFYGGPGFGDDPDHRAFLRLLRTAQAGDGVRIADVRPVFERLGAEVAIEHDGKRLHAVDLPAVGWLTAFCEGLADRTFESALEAFEAEAGADLAAFREELGRLGLLGERVTDPAVGRLAFYLERYEVPVDRRNEGVVLADATAAATVDRPAVFYLGMDAGWTPAPPRRPWVDRDAEYAKHRRQFQRRLQNGVEQHYLVQDERGGRAVTPCLFFEELLDGPVERFSDLDSVAHVRSYRRTRTGFDHEPIDVEPEPVTSISQSSLNALLNCPRDYLFGRLVEDPDRDYFAVGTLFHDFAEVYATHPERIDAEAVGDVVELMLESTRPFDRPLDRAANRTRYRVGLETIAAYLDANEPLGAWFLSPAGGWGRNVVAERLGLAVDGPHTEWWFDDDALGLKGKVDLVCSPTHLLDYKSGAKRSARRVVGDAALDPPSDTPDVQALHYLTYHRSQVDDRRLRFTFFHFLETLDDAVAGEADLDDCLTTVPYHPEPFASHLAGEELYVALRHDAPNACTKTFAQVEYADYRAVVEAHPFPDTRDAERLLASSFGDALHDLLRTHVGDYAYVERGCAQALRYLRDVRDAAFFAEDLDAFEAFVDDQLDALNRYRAGEDRFPVEGPGGEPNYRRVDHRDMLLEGDG